MSLKINSNVHTVDEVRQALQDIDTLLPWRDIVEVKTKDWTLTEADHRKTFIVDAADLTATLPATKTPGIEFTFIVKQTSAGTGFLVTPAAADAIHGGGLTSVDGESLKNTAASDAEGDLVVIMGDGDDGWWILNLIGTWAKV